MRVNYDSSSENEVESVHEVVEEVVEVNDDDDSDDSLDGDCTSKAGYKRTF